MMAPKANGERGAALLSILMIVAAMSVVALLALGALGKAVTLTKTTSQRSMAGWSLISAEEAARAVISETLQTTGGAISADMPGLKEPITLPSEAGIMSVQVRDAANCFNLNSLLSEAALGAPLNQDAAEAYRNLLVSAGMFEADALLLSDTLSDWLDGDTQPRVRGAENAYYQALDVPYRTARQPLDNMTELYAIAGYTPEALAELSAFLCVRPDSRQLPLNINTLRSEEAPLLVALFSDALSIDMAARMIEARPVGGWQSVEEFLEADEIQAIAESAYDASVLSVTTNIFEVEARLSSPDISRRMMAIMEVSETGQVETVWRSVEAY